MPAADETHLMRSALRLAARGRGRTSPNPMVGCVIVAGGEVVGSGWHRRAGEPHAEVLALREAGERARGATAFVTLEPCAHHGRTPPCAEALIAAGVSRVVTAMEDPDLRTAGRGVQALREAGIEVEVGLLEDEARKLNEAFVHHRTTGRPFVTYKAAATLDGRTAAADSSSQWITSPEARRDVHRLRAQSDAICCAVRTITADNPNLTVRGVPTYGRKLLRVVLDSHLRTPPDANVLSPDAPTVIFTAADAGDPRAAALRRAGAEVVTAPDDDGLVDLGVMLEMLGARGVVSLLLEGGATLARRFALEARIDRYVLYIAPKLLGTTDWGVLKGWSAPNIGEAMQLEFDDVRRIGPDLRVVAYPARKPS